MSTKALSSILCTSSIGRKFGCLILAFNSKFYMANSPITSTITPPKSQMCVVILLVTFIRQDSSVLFKNNFAFCIY